MSKDFITFRSVTPAQRAQQLLRRGGVQTLLQRTPARLQERGCGYCLRLHPSRTEQALTMLRGAGIAYSGVYRDGEQLP